MLLFAASFVIMGIEVVKISDTEIAIKLIRENVFLSFKNYGFNQ